MNPISKEDSAKYSVSGSPPEGQAPWVVPSQVQVDLAGLSHQGNVRPNNEDHYLVARFGRALQTLLTNLPEGLVPDRFDEVGYGMVVADGMGGRAAGEVASQLAISTLVHLVVNTPDWIMGHGDAEFERVSQRILERYSHVAAALSEQARIDPSRAGMGTTLTLARSLGSDLILAHLGDSRVYLLRGSKLHQLTRDHTMAQALVEAGILRPEEAVTHRLRHVLTRVLGGSRGPFEPEIHRLALADQDQVLLCTDGLTDMVDNATIRAVLQDAGSASEACQGLVELALKQGGKDNVTVVLARYRFSQEP